MKNIWKGERKLDKSENINKFEKNQKDTFVLKAADLGVLKKVCLKISYDISSVCFMFTVKFLILFCWKIKCF